MQERLSKAAIQDVVSKISISSIIYDRAEFRLLDKGDGYLLQLIYMEPDADTPNGEPMPQHCRKWYVSPFSTESEIVRTAYKAVHASMLHRLGEHFRYKGAQVYSPHMSVAALAAAAAQGDFDVRD